MPRTCSLAVLAGALGLLAVVVPNGLSSPASAQTVGWWTFEEGVIGQPPAAGPSVLDISGNGFHGTPSGEATYATGEVSAVALRLPDQRGVVHVPDDPLFELQTGFTLEAYVRVDALGSVCCDIRPLLFRGDRRAGLDPWFLGVNNDGGLTLQIHDGTTQFTLRSDVPIGLGEWAHVAGTFDASTGRMRLYIDGLQVAQSTGFVSPPMAELDPTRSPGVAIANANSATQGVRGAVDSARITARALGPADMLPPTADCRPDLDRDGALTIFDFLAFQNAFDVAAPIADFDGDGALTIFDFLSFQNAFDAGCP